MAAIMCDCGAVLVEDVSDEGVTPVGGEPIVFRRDTDYVVCASCHKVYKAKTLLAGGSLAESLVDEADGGDVERDADQGGDADDVIARLERMVDEAED